MDERDEVERQRILARWQALGPDDPWGQDVEILNAQIVALDTALAASRATSEAFRQDFNTVQAALATTQEKLRDAERARDDARELVALEFERGKLCGIAEEREHAEQFKARWFHQTTQEAIARAEHAEQRVAGALAIIAAKIKGMESAPSAFYVTDLMDIEGALTRPPVAPSGGER